MKKTFLSALLLATALTTGGAKAETIFEALSTAYDTNPTLQAQRAYLRSVDENVAIAKSGFRPNIYLTGGYSDSDVHNNNVPSQTGGRHAFGRRQNQPADVQRLYDRQFGEVCRQHGPRRTKQSV